jgi:dTDP-4-dehydrorhamnose reductase
MTPGGGRPVLVTGANGLVGSRLVARLSGAGRSVIAAGRGPQRAVPGPLVRYLEIDLLRRSALRDLIAAERPAAVVHAAAMTDVDACEKDPQAAWTLNVAAVEEAALGCREVQARLVALSTDYVFDGDADTTYDEEAPAHPRGVYARTKLAGEEAALVLAPGATVARVAVIFSGRRGAKRTFAVAAAEALERGKEVKAFHDQVVSPTLADNAAEMVIGVLDSGAQGIFHCAGATALSRVDFCRKLARKLSAEERLVVPVSLADLALPAPRPLRCGLSVRKVQGLLGRSVPLEIDAALDRFLAERKEG